jgi:hypothetical protein
MARIFNSIRQRLLKENRLTRYLVYAIGEILLVVIGILIALQINTWNEQRKQKAQEVKLLENFKTTLQGDTAQFSYYIEEFGTIENSINILIEHMDEDLPYQNSLQFHFLNSTAVWSPGMDLGVFSTLTSTDLNIISNDSLKQGIVDYYAFANRDFRPLTQRYQEIISNASRELFNTRFDQIWNTSARAMIPHDYDSLKTDKEYNYFLHSLKHQLFYLVQDPLKNADDKAGALIRAIDNELKELTHQQ